MGFSRQECWSGFPFLLYTDSILCSHSSLTMKSLALRKSLENIPSLFQWTFVIYLEPSTVPFHWHTFFFSLFLLLSPHSRFFHLPIDWHLQELPGYLQATICLQNIKSGEFSKFSLNSHLLSHLSAPQPTVACFLLSINSGPNSPHWFSNLPTITLSTQIYFPFILT